MSKESFQNLTQLPKTVWGFYWKYGINGKKSMLLLWMLIMLFTYSGGVIWPNVQRWIVALFETPVPEGMSFVEHSIPVILTIVFFEMSMTFSSLMRDTVNARLWTHTENDVSEILTNYTHNQSMTFWINKMSGAINTQINYIISGLIDGFTKLWQCVGYLMIISVNALLLLSINRYVCGLFLFSLCFRIIYAYNMRKRVKKASEEASGANSALNGKLIDSFSNYSIVKLFAGAKKENTILKEPRQKRVSTRLYSRYTMRLFWAVPGVMWDVFFGLTLLFCCILYQRGEMAVSEIVYTVSVFLEVMGCVAMLINSFPDIIDKTAAAKKAYKELVLPLDIVDKENAKPLRIKNGTIQFKNVSFKYRKKLY